MSEEKQPVTVALEDELVAQVKEKYGDKVVVQDVANKAIKFLLASTSIPADVLSSIGEAQDQLRDLANAVAPVKNFCESIDRSMRVISPTATSAVGDSIANMQEKAKAVAARKEITQDRTQVTVGMSGKPQNNSTKKIVNELSDKSTETPAPKEPAKKITNELIGKAPNPTVAKILADFKKNKPTVGHPSSIIGPDMGKEISIQQ